MSPERCRVLVAAVIADLRDYRPPLSHQFLVDFEVTLDEAYDLADTVGNLLSWALVNAGTVEDYIEQLAADGTAS